MTGLQLPPEDRALSPYTGWTRAHWAAVADHLLLCLRPHFSATRARVLPPGRASAYGADSDGLEGFARSFLLFGFRLIGEARADPHGFLDLYRDGLIAGTDPASPEAWPRPDRLGQAKVEAASIALILALTRPWLWDTLSKPQQRNVIAWLATVIGQEYPPTNWLWFRVSVETFLASVGGAHDPADIAEDLALFESLYREHGWYSDGPERSFDYYCGWAMQFYPSVWAQLPGAERFGAAELTPRWRARLSDFLDDYITLIGTDGVPVLQGRSLIYRFAAAAPLWVGAATGATTLSPGTLRRGASGILRAFLSRGAVDADGLLTLGLFGQWPQLAQSYSGSDSPYWAAKGMFGLALPATHPVWTAVEEPLPVERGDVLRVITAPGWVLSATRSDGVVRVLNHGTDHGPLGGLTTDSPLYARLGYSSATIPPLTGATLDALADNAVCVLDASGRASHRSGFLPLGSGTLTCAMPADAVEHVAAWAASRGQAHWVDVPADAGPDHGSGRAGVVTVGPTLTVASVLRGPWEVRVIRVDAAAQAGGAAPAGVGGSGAVESPDRYRIRVSGWPLAGAAAAPGVETPGGETPGGETPGVVASACDPEAVSVDAIGIRLGALESTVHTLAGAAGGVGSVHVERGTSPLGEAVTVPWLTFPAVAVGEALAVGVMLTADDATRARGGTPRVELATTPGGVSIDVTWPDGARCTHVLPNA